ncbi:MAG: Nitroreductase family protein [Euryarchaeota archaeon ADurb.BinA087]|nr:MAG: Nitroreductase family protein [Euryarchaeota archaeon ADurb.BinA087]
MRIGGFGWEWQENRFVQSVSLYQVTYQPLAMQPIGATFMELTQYDHLSPSDQNLKKTPPPLAKPVPKGAQYIPLPKPGTITVPPMDLRKAFETRRSLRHYRKEPLSIEELTYLLWCSQGIVQVVDPFYTLRNVPSAGGRHALETYLLINRVTTLRPGLYRYVPFSHSLIEIDSGLTITDKVMAACLGQAFIRSSAVTFLWSTIIYRMAWRYSERAYRLVHLDAGHVCQNLYLAAEQVGCGACAIGAFDDKLMADLLGVDIEEEFVLYCAAVGKR